MKFDPDVHQRRSIRLRGFDYAADGAYFITICVHQRECLLGEVVDGAMVSSPAGVAVRSIWETLRERFPNVMLDEFLAMPNHVHGILFLTNRGEPGICSDDPGNGRGEPCVRPDGPDNRRGEPCVRPIGQNDRNGQGDYKDQGDHKDRPYGTAPDSLGRIMQAFKSLTTNAYIRGVEQDDWPLFPGRLWQRNYYERILRNDDELDRARRYIADNPAQWVMDVENPANRS